MGMEIGRFRPAHSAPRLKVGGIFLYAVPAPVLYRRRDNLTSTTRPNAVHRIRQAVSAAIAGLCRPSPLAPSRAHARMEPLEERRLMAGDASVVQSMPFSLEFDGSRAGTILDKDG